MDDYRDEHDPARWPRLTRREKQQAVARHLTLAVLVLSAAVGVALLWRFA